MGGRGGGGCPHNATLTFFAFLNSVFDAFNSKMLYLKGQDSALEDTFFLFHFTVKSPKYFNNSYLKMKFHMGGGRRPGNVRKVLKRITYYLIGPELFAKSQI